MKRYTKSLAGLVLMCLVAGCGGDTGSVEGNQPTGNSSFFYGARMIPGDGSAPIDNANFVVTDGKITVIGKKGEVTPPKGSAQVDLSGRTIVPVFIDLSAQPGMNNYAQYGPKNYNRDSVIADLDRYQYYGTIAVLTAGTDSGSLAASVGDEIRQGKIKGAHLYTAGGIAAKGVVLPPFRRSRFKFPARLMPRRPSTIWPTVRSTRSNSGWMTATAKGPN